MKDTRFVFLASVCDTSLYPEGPKTIAEAKTLGMNKCPNRSICDKTLHPEQGRQCIMYFAVEVVRHAVKAGHSIAAEMVDFRDECPGVPGGFYWSDDRKKFEVIIDREEAFKKIEEFAVKLYDSLNIKQVGSDFVAVQSFCIVDGAVDLQLMEMFEGRFGTNGGRGCDVGPGGGPCSCGAWH